MAAGTRKAATFCKHQRRFQVDLDFLLIWKLRHSWKANSHISRTACYRKFNISKRGVFREKDQKLSSSSRNLGKCPTIVKCCHILIFCEKLDVWGKKIKADSETTSTTDSWLFYKFFGGVIKLLVGKISEGMFLKKVQKQKNLFR